ncbi:T9SS type A sorting domain-containing protein [Rubrivirga sp.]|uniref:T9SS type A sorting domain-containing protein n=1 Tax=Rubrivirga sp. TaxID=1885344 RepID=UPI003B51D579
MRLSTLLVLAAVLATAAPAAAQNCTASTAQEVTIREINAIPQDNVDQLNAAGADVTIEQAQMLLTNDLEDACVTFTAVLLTDPFLSGLASLNAEGIPGRIHAFVRDVTAATEGVAGMGTQIVDGRGNGEIQQFFPGDEIVVTGTVSPFEGNGGKAMQIAPVSIVGTGNAYGEDDPLRQPVVVTTEDIHDVYGTGTESRSQIDWSAYSDFNGQYVRFETTNLVQSTSGGGRVDVLLSSPSDDAQINTYDTSVCFRNDIGVEYYPNGNMPSCLDNPFNPPVTGIVNIQGFLSFQGDDGSFDYATPDEANYVLVPFEDDDFEVAVAPPIVTFEDTGLATTDGADVRVTAVPGTSGNTVASVVVSYETSSGITGTVDLTNTSGDVYEGTIPNLVAGDFVTYSIVATDNQGAATPASAPITRLVVDGPITSIFQVQATPNGGVGGSGITTADPVEFDLDAVVQSVVRVRDNLTLATIQDDPDLGPFTGVWVEFAPGAELEPGDRITITSAQVVEAFTVTTLRNVSYVETATGDILGYKEVTTDLFNGDDGAATAEQHEGILLTFDDVTVVATNADDPSGPFGEFLISSDGTAANGLRVDDLADGVTFEGNDPGTVYTAGGVLDFVRGPLYFSFGNYKLVPPSADDIGDFSVSREGDLATSAVRIVGAFPNPATGAARVRFELATAGDVSLRVFDATGRQVAVVAEGTRAAGAHEVSADLGGLASGVYVVRLVAGGEVATARIAVVR